MKFSTLIQGSTLVFALLASATASAVSYDSQHSINRYNNGGTSTKVLPPHGGHFCYLSRVGIEDTDTGGEMARCTVRRSGTVWLLEAWLEKSSDADVHCSAICYNNGLL